jgi:uncharacterized protein YdeI (BOF family)
MILHRSFQKAVGPALLVLVLHLACTGKVRAGDDGDPAQNKWHLTTVAWLAHHQEQFVLDTAPATLIGRISKQYEKFTYIFSDGTGTMELYSDTQLPLNTSIVVRGDFDEGTLIVKSWRPTGTR